jgi:peptide chain release factor 2
LNDLRKDLDSIEKRLSNLEFQRMFNGKFDANNAYVEINSGSGGTEAQDWAEMLLRMYLKFAANQGFTAEVTDYMAGEVAGLKNACIYVTGEYAYGWLRTETGVHRLVRKSPFDSGNRRHTSFASVYVSPEINDDIDIEINPADLRVDTYRASGAGGQHVNRTDSAIRITHIPTGIVVQCQSDRSQHKNRSTAMNQLKGKLYDLELQKRNQELQKSEESKAENGWGSQIRSYVLDQSRIKDLRTGVEAGDTGKVLDGDLEKFIRASLQLGA